MSAIQIIDIDVTKIITDQYRNEKQTDVSDLVESYQTVGRFVHPIAIREDGMKFHIVAGRRRLLAAKKMKLKSIPAIIVNSANWLQVMEDENGCRQDMVPSDKYKLAEEIKAWKKAQRQELKKTDPEKYEEAKERRYDDEVGEIVGLKRSNLHKVGTIMEAAKSDPDKFGDIVEEMDKSGNISKAYQEYQVRSGEKAPKGHEIVVADDDADGSEPVVVKSRNIITDDFGKEVPDHLRDQFSNDNFYERSHAALSQVLKDLQANINHIPWIEDTAIISRAIKQSSEIIWNSRPSAVCVYCHGNKKNSKGEKCNHCRGSGWFPAKKIPELQANGVNLSEFKS